MSELPWSKFFWSDWESDQGLRLCSLQAQGLWMRMLCVCAKGEPKGYLAINNKPLDETGVARLCGILADEAVVLMEELEANGVFSRDRRGWIYSRRMMRDAKRVAEGRKHAKKRWSQAPEKRPVSRSPSGLNGGAPTPQKPEARSQNKPPSPLPGEWEEHFSGFWGAFPKGRSLNASDDKVREAFRRSAEVHGPDVVESAGVAYAKAVSKAGSLPTGVLNFLKDGSGLVAQYAPRTADVVKLHPVDLDESVEHQFLQKCRDAACSENVIRRYASGSFRIVTENRQVVAVLEGDDPEFSREFRKVLAAHGMTVWTEDFLKKRRARRAKA